jgi:two-component system, NarL family, response regulator LiaR
MEEAPDWKGPLPPGYAGHPDEATFGKAMTDTEESNGPLRVIVADDDPLARRVVRGALQDAGIVVVAEAGTGGQAVELTLFYQPDVVLMDVVMPELDGISAMRKILKVCPDQIVVLLTSADDEVGMMGLQAGAWGFLNKDLNIDALPRAVIGAAAGEPAITRSMSARLLDQLRRRPPSGSAGMRPVKSELTSREWEVLDLLCERKTTDAMASELFLSPETVRSHVKAIYRKLGVNSRDAAIERAANLRQLH